jgi:hypothetical protein
LGNTRIILAGYIAKIHVGSAHSRAATFIRSEARAPTVPTRLITAPVHYCYQGAYNYRYLILSKVIGHDLTMVNPKNRVVALGECISFLRAQPRITGLVQRPAIYWLSLLPLLAIINIYKRTLPLTVILKLVGLSVKELLWVLARPSVLVHRDLNYQNCFVTKDGLSLIDYQLTAYADPL